ncbi:MAG: glycosyltransferase, partial [Bacteroidales bacterium]|nr:glycosyltransferase [Bacteroidales bacterium]
LLGKDGNQNDELQELIDFLKVHEKPDVVHLSNALLLGLTKQIREQLNVPVVCSLQDEDVWVDAMNDHYREKVWNLMSEKAEEVDAFIAVSDYYAQEMKSKMKIPDNKMHVVPIGIDSEIYQYKKPAEKPQVIGYLSRMYKEHGFGLMIDAYIKLKQVPKHKDVLLKLSGGYTADDKKFVKKQIKKLKKAGIFQDVEFIEDYLAEERYKFFNKISILSVPVLKGEAFGTYQLESMACGIPIVQPDLGAFSEIVDQTKGGVIYSPNTADALAQKWMEVLADPQQILNMSEEGKKAVAKKYAIDAVSKKVSDIYEMVTQ